MIPVVHGGYPHPFTKRMRGATSRFVSFVSHFVPPMYMGEDELGVQEHRVHAFSGAWQVTGETSETQSSRVSWKPRLSSLSHG
jgi:hypothetical protein